MQTVLSAEKYEAGAAKMVRAAGKVPAVIYGHGQETKNISVDKQDFRRAFRKVGKATLLEIDFSGEKIPTLVHIVDVHPISGDPVHIDFYAVSMNEEVSAVVPVQFTGVSDAVKLLGGTLTIMHDQINIKCLPKYLIRSVEMSIEGLATLSDTITVSDIPFPKNITVLDSPDTVVAGVSAPRVASEEEAAEEAEAEEKKEEAAAEAAEEKKEE